MTTEEREELRQFIQNRYQLRRGEARTYWLRPWKRSPEELSEIELDQFIDHYRLATAVESALITRDGNRNTFDGAKAVLLRRRGRPVGFDPITWFMICKLLIDILLLWFRFQQSDVREA